MPFEVPHGLMFSDRQTGPLVWPDRRQCGGNLTSTALIGKALRATLIGGFEVEWDSAEISGAAHPSMFFHHRLSQLPHQGSIDVRILAVGSHPQPNRVKR